MVGGNLRNNEGVPRFRGVKFMFYLRLNANLKTIMIKGKPYGATERNCMAHIF